MRIVTTRALLGPFSWKPSWVFADIHGVTGTWEGGHGGAVL